MIEEMITASLAAKNGAMAFFFGLALAFVLSRLFYWDVIQDVLFESANKEEDDKKASAWVIGLCIACLAFAFLIAVGG